MKINLSNAFETITEYWSPRIAGDLNGQQVKLAKFKAGKTKLKAPVSEVEFAFAK